MNRPRYAQGVSEQWSIATLVGEALDVDVQSTSRLGGGDVAEAHRVVLGDGRTVFAKTHRNPPPDFFATEAAGLDWLRAARAVSVPDVLAVGERLLVLEWIERGAAEHFTEVSFGRSLASLHQAGAPCFGRLDRRTTGSRRLPNDPCERWSEFYAARRLLPLARLAADDEALAPRTIRRLETLAADLDRFGASDEPPARLHGDLWAGNRMIDRNGVNWLIDPAAHGGHREFDLAMMHLFGGFGADSFSAYRTAFPLADGWEQRVPLHQLAPLVVHAIKFGGGYAASTERALDDLNVPT